MRSLILTILYLIKDTINRWLTNIASPVARILVVFFLTLCALFFLGSYVISTKLVRQQIERQGADSISMVLPQAGNVSLPNEEQLRELLQVDSWVVKGIGYASDSDLRNVPIYTYDFNRLPQLYPLLASGKTSLFCRADAAIPEGLRSLSIAKQSYTLNTRHLPDDHPLIRLGRGAFILAPPDVAQRLFEKSLDTATLYANLRLVNQDITVENLSRLEQFCINYANLEGLQANTISAIELLRSMDVLLSNQVQTRAAFCLGIAAIVGILLTSLSSMEFRQNEYVYTLLKSFGIHPLVLILCFIMENIALVTLSFIAAIYTFMEAQKILLTQFSQYGNIRLDLDEIMPEIKLIALSLVVCVFISAIPISLAANKEIGRILK